jgi:GxxExxY protein
LSFFEFLNDVDRDALASILASPRSMDEADRLNTITKHIINASIAVHRELVPGLLESAYEACLAYELRERRLFVEEPKPLPLIYRGLRLNVGCRLDMLVERSVVVEVKSIERFEAVHGAQLVTYLRQSGCKVGLVLNFNVKWFADQGILRRVNGFPE